MKSRMNYGSALISPLGLSAFSIFVFLTSYLIPPRVYEGLLEEHDYFSTSWMLPVFYVGCVVIFAFGARLAMWSPLPATPEKSQVAYNFRSVHIILSTATLLTFYSSYVIISKNPVLDAVALASAQILKTSTNGSGSLSEFNSCMSPIICWALYRYLRHREEASANERLVLKIEIAAGIAAGLMLAAVHFARSEIMALLIGVAVVALGHISRARHIPLSRIVFYCVLVLFLILGMFLAFSFIRGSTTSSLLLVMVFGYGPASFNHLAAFLGGVFRYPYAGQLVYTIPFLLDLPLVNHLVDLRSLLGLPDPLYVWQSEFIVTGNVGLNSSFIWITAFGYYFMDLGYWAFPFILGLGAITGRSWRSFTIGGIFGVVAYPFFAETIVLWFTSNLMVLTGLSGVIFSLLLVWISESIFAGEAGSSKKNITLSPA